ncbi:hypothetical protein AMS68_001639 [Peltaster fructicola]|uniref:Zn(2)-C6 fungal-type domain-containing protein n=1 Tax=Peltaster fructicola TaxID=286661 RepID=A0A6H0XMY8_9PEZI|nr:hypothetical protein AMS68_001639 [Peltaster fructicola]
MEQGVAVDESTILNDASTNGSEGSKRVCDRCISKKVKCDLQRPRCSRCTETDSECIYSAVKRRPGPRKGWTRNSKRHLGSSLPTSRKPPSVSKSIHSAANDSTSILPHTASPVDSKNQWHGVATTPFDQHTPLEHPTLDLTSAQASALLECYFAQDHHMIPLFNRESFYRLYEAGQLPTVLIHTVAAVTTVIWAPESFNNRPSNPRAFLDALLRSASTTELEITLDITLYEFQVLCLLAHYDFHQRPGPRSWVRIGNLTRKAYRLGLNQLENPQHCALFDNTGRLEEKEDWRRLWWVVYCLDSYSNITAGTPVIVELESLRTALPMFHDFQTTDIRCNPEHPIFLPADTAEIWSTMQALTTCGCPHEFDMHVVMGSLINEAATCLRLVRQNPCSRLHNRIQAFEDHLAAARVALPANYLDPVRRIWTNETSHQHHARLYNIVLMHSATIMLVLAKLIDSPPSDDALNWQRVLECCEDIVSAVKYWDSTRLTTADPAICFTFSGVLTLLHVCSKCSPASSVSAAAAELQASFDRQIRILKLYLEHFGTNWFLPRFLLASHEKLTQLISKPMQIWEAKRVIQGHQTLLQQRWLSTMSRVEQSSDQDTQESIDATVFFENWPMEEWLTDLMGGPELVLP